MEKFRTPFMSKLLEEVTRRNQRVYEQALNALGVTQKNVYLCEIRRIDDMSVGWVDEFWVQGICVGRLMTDYSEGICKITFEREKAHDSV